MDHEIRYKIRWHHGEWEMLSPATFRNNLNGEVLSNVDFSNYWAVTNVELVLKDLRASYYSSKARALEDRRGIYRHTLSYPRAIGKTRACMEFIKYVCPEDKIFYCGKHSDIRKTPLEEYFISSSYRCEANKLRGVRSEEDVVLICDDIDYSPTHNMKDLMDCLRTIGNNLIIIKIES